MTSTAIKFITKRVFKETAKNKFGQEDPYFETVPATRLGFNTTKKKRKALPPGLTDEEARILTKVKRRAYRLDLALCNFCGTRFGWSSVIGLVPAIGDVLDFLLAYMVVLTCNQVKPPLPSSVKRRMELNLIIDFVIGLIPFLGDIADAMYKCNTRNAVLLENELRRRGQQRLKAQNRLPEVDPSLPEEYDHAEDERMMTAQNGGPPPSYTSTKEPRRPGRTYASGGRRAPGGLLGGGREYDEEAAGPEVPPRP